MKKDTDLGLSCHSVVTASSQERASHELQNEDTELRVELDLVLLPLLFLMFVYF